MILSICNGQTATQDVSSLITGVSTMPIHITLINKHCATICIRLFMVVFLSTNFSQTLFAANTVGSVSFVKGNVTAQIAEEQARPLFKGGSIFEGDNIQTLERSFVIITFQDGTKITVRPASNFSVSQYGQKSAELELHDGALLTRTGEIAKTSPENFQIKTSDTTVNAQQGDFSVRICKEDCQQEDNKLHKGESKKEQVVIARIVEIEGPVVAINAKELEQETRPLAVGAPLYSADIVESDKNAYAVLVFKDEGRISVEAESNFEIQSYKFSDSATQNKTSYDLVKGGMRLLTGIIATENKEDFSVNTPVATIGIRGTGFDLVYREGKLYSYTWQGIISQENESGTTELSEPDATVIETSQTTPKTISVDDIPRTTPLAPRPDKVSVTNEAELFSIITLEDADVGTYVDVQKGHIRVKDGDGTPFDLGKSESSYTDTSGKTQRIERESQKGGSEHCPVN